MKKVEDVKKGSQRVSINKSILYMTLQVEGLVLSELFRLSIAVVFKKNVSICKVRSFISRHLERVI